MSTIAKQPNRDEETPAPATPKRRPAQRREARLALLIILPAVICELFIHIIPMFMGVWMAFLKLNQRTLRNWVHAPFIGMDNFRRGLAPSGNIGSEFYSTVGRTLFYVALVLVISWTFGMTAAVFLQNKFRGRAAFRTLFFIPYAIPGFVSAIAWKFMFAQQEGAVNKILVDELHLLHTKPFWLIGGNSFWTMIIVSVWGMWPFAFIMLLAALQTIPDDVYEAASIDGASRWQQFWRITVPMIRQPNGTLILLMSLWLFNQFGVPYMLFGPSSPEQATLLSPLIYKNSFQQWDFGLSAAMSVLLLLVLFVASIIYIRMALPKENDND